MIRTLHQKYARVATTSDWMDARTNCSVLRLHGSQMECVPRNTGVVLDSLNCYASKCS